VNLLAIPWIKSALRSRLYPAVFQWATVAIFVLLLGSTLFGPNNAGQNFGMALTWTIWWPLLPLSFILFGRFWCAICPFAWLTDWVQKAVGVRLSVPLILRRASPWTIGGVFLLVTYLDEAWGFDRDTRKTGYLLLAILAAVIFFAAFFERRTFCRHVCFIGAFAGNYSRAGILELRAAADRCAGCSSQGCYHGTACAPGCPVFLFTPNVTDSGTCQLCANCLKNCPRDAIRLSLRKPAVELWSVRQPRVFDAVLAAVLAGVVLLEQFAAGADWNRLIGATGALLGLDPFVSFPLVYAVLLALFLAAPLVGLGLASLGSQALRHAVSRVELKRNFACFGYAIIPLALAGHLANGFDRLLTRSRTVPFALAAMAGWYPGDTRAAWLPRPVVLWIEMAVLALGGAVSLYVAFRLARRREGRPGRFASAPHFVLLLCLLAANLYAVIAMTR
jgi:hypothetical protein